MGIAGDRAIVQLHPTRRCNLHCRHCYSSSGPHVSAQTPPDVLCRLVADAAGLGYQVVGISGGEPLLYPALLEVLQAAKAAGLRTTVTSNGMLLTERRLGELVGFVDVLAISLDGRPESHVAMRGDDRAFAMLDRRMEGVRRSGIPFGLITTLTQHNVHEAEFVVGYAVEHGASLVQLHPLEPEGAARVNLPGSVPDVRESAFAIVEGARLAAAYEIPVQVDVARIADLVGRPDLFLAEPPEDPVALAAWLSPLVVETDGTVVPVTYGFPRMYAVGNVCDRDLSALALSWDPEPFLELCRAVAARLLSQRRGLFNWYDELVREARVRTEAGQRSPYLHSPGAEKNAHVPAIDLSPTPRRP